MSVTPHEEVAQALDPLVPDLDEVGFANTVDRVVEILDEALAR